MYLWQKMEVYQKKKEVAVGYIFIKDKQWVQRNNYKNGNIEKN